MHIQSDNSQSVLVSAMDNENPTTVSQSAVPSDLKEAPDGKNGNNSEEGLVQINDNEKNAVAPASSVKQQSNNLIDLAEESSSELADLAAADSKDSSSLAASATGPSAISSSATSHGGEEHMSTASEASSSVLREDVTKRPVTVAVSVSESVMAMTPTSPRSITTASMSASGKSEISSH